MTKKLIQVERETVYLDGSTLKSAASEIAGYITKYGSDAVIEEVQYTYSDGKYLAIFTKHLETDEEYQQRQAAEEKLRLLREEWDAKEYARLQAKFAGK